MRGPGRGSSGKRCWTCTAQKRKLDASRSPIFGVESLAPTCPSGVADPQGLSGSSGRRSASRAMAPVVPAKWLTSSRRSQSRQGVARSSLASAAACATAVIVEQHDEWAVAERRYFSAESMKLPTTPLLSTTTQEILAAIG